MRVDIVAQDARGKDLLIAEVKSRPMDDASARDLLDYMREARTPARFGMVGDPSYARFLDFEHDPGHGFSCVIPAPEVLSHYARDYGSRRIFHTYLTSLFEAWLRDHAYHWMSKEPPATRPLSDLGLLPLLEGGTTLREVTFETDPVR